MGRVLPILFLVLSLQSAALAQTTNPIPPAQSLAPTPNLCGTGSQSVRVCNDDFQSCSSVCTATALDPTADTAGCTTRCCNQFKACLSIRGCGALTSVNCF